MDYSGKQLSNEGIEFLKEGITLRLSQWSALQMAVENEWGGHNSRLKAEQLVHDIFTWFTQSKGPLYLDDLENLLEETLLSLNTEADDGSIEEVAFKLMTMHEECLEQKYEAVEALRQQPRLNAALHVKQGNDGDDESDSGMEGDDSCNMMVDAIDPLPTATQSNMSLDKPGLKESAEEQDGWTAVSSSRKNRSKRK